ncbi:MAG: creatininase family protein [Phycisphaeraceae bacterium]
MNQQNHQSRPYVLYEATHRQLLDEPPNLAVLPWGATEAHNYHLPYATDVIEASSIATEAARLAHERGARPIVLPAVPFGNDQQQLDQVATISIRTRTAAAILRDVAESLKAQNIDRLLIVNAHGGNTFKPLVRDIQSETGVLIVAVNFWEVVPGAIEETFEIIGDHANEMETSLLLHLCPELVNMEAAGPGTRNKFAIPALNNPGVWTPRPWSTCHPDTGSGDPSHATAEKGAAFFGRITAAIADVVHDLSKAEKGQSPYL